MLVGTPTQAEAERLAADAAAILGDDKVLHFPAWETLPFERVSPGVETMGQRLACSPAHIRPSSVARCGVARR